MEEKKVRIKGWMAVALITFAIIVDLSEFIITWLGLVVIGGIISSLISVIAGFIFWIWYMILGVKAFSSPKHFAVRTATFVGELIPFLDAIPLLSFLWTIGTITMVLMVRAEDKGGLLGTAASIIQTKVQYNDYEKKMNSMDRLDGLRSQTNSNTNTLDLKNKNPQPGTTPLANQQQKKQGDIDQSARLRQEIQKLKDDIGYAKQEIQRLQPEAEDKKNAYEHHKKYTTEMIQLLKDQGDDQGKIKSMTATQEQVLNQMYSDYQKIIGKIGMIDDATWSKNNRLIELERKAGTLKLESAKFGG